MRQEACAGWGAARPNGCRLPAALATEFQRTMQSCLDMQAPAKGSMRATHSTRSTLLPQNARSEAQRHLHIAGPQKDKVARLRSASPVAGDSPSARRWHRPPARAPSLPAALQTALCRTPRQSRCDDLLRGRRRPAAPPDGLLDWLPQSLSLCPCHLRTDPGSQLRAGFSRQPHGVQRGAGGACSCAANGRHGGAAMDDPQQLPQRGSSQESLEMDILRLSARWEAQRTIRTGDTPGQALRKGALRADQPVACSCCSCRMIWLDAAAPAVSNCNCLGRGYLTTAVRLTCAMLQGHGRRWPPLRPTWQRQPRRPTPLVCLRSARRPASSSSRSASTSRRLSSHQCALR